MGVKEGYRRLTADLPEKLHRLVKSRAAADGKDMNDYVAEILAAHEGTDINGNPLEGAKDSKRSK